MIELQADTLVFEFSEVHPGATVEIGFQRTLRIPDDGNDYSLPPGLGLFPLRHVDDFGANIPKTWVEHGGVMLPMYQSEALWLSFTPSQVVEHGTDYPFALKIAAGKINAVTGEPWRNGLAGDPQDYVVTSEQPWLDGYCVEEGIIRQFVAMPLGSGYSAEEQITGEAQHGGLQIIAYPMKREVFERRFPRIDSRSLSRNRLMCCSEASAGFEMGLAPGGRMRQEIYEDPFDINDWDREHASRCFVHIANSLVWHAITGQNPPTTPRTAKEYTDAGLPWFEYYHDDGKALEGSDLLRKLKSVVTLGADKGDVPLPENESVTPQNIKKIRAHLKPGQVREGTF